LKGEDKGEGEFPSPRGMEAKEYVAKRPVERGLARRAE